MSDLITEFGGDLRLRDSENMGPTSAELRMAAEIERLRARLAEAEELLREWLDNCCPWTHTQLFLNNTSSLGDKP